MGKSQHYIPCFVIGNWSSPSVASLLPAAALPHAQRLCTVSGVPRRDRMVCAYDKALARLSPVPARNLFCHPNFYTLPVYQDRLKQGFMLSMFNDALGATNKVSRSREELEACADLDFDRGLAERRISHHESNAASVLDRLLSTRRLTRGDSQFLEKFLTLAFLRTPAWATNFQCHTAQVAHAQALEVIGRSADDELAALAGQIMADNLQILAALTFHTQASAFSQVERLRIRIVRAVGRASFVLTDLPVWPFRYSEFADGSKRIARSWCRFGEFDDVMAWFPFHPRMGLQISSGALRGLAGAPAFGDTQVRRLNTVTASLAGNIVVFPDPDLDAHLEISAASL
jgi:hypothetical protein